MVTQVESFRSLMRRATPWWLHGRIAWAVLQGIADQLDMLVGMLYDAVAARFPRVEQPDALPLLGIERKIPRGRAEADATYVSRLVKWLDDHRTRGGPYAMLSQLHDFWAATPFGIVLAYQSGFTFTMATDGTVTRALIPARGEPGMPWPHWRLYFSWLSEVHSDGTWSDAGTWGDGGVWDSDLSADDVYDIRCVPLAWNAAHTNGTIWVISPSAELWDFPAGLWSDGGVWGSEGSVISIDAQN